MTDVVDLWLFRVQRLLPAGFSKPTTQEIADQLAEWKREDEERNRARDLSGTDIVDKLHGAFEAERAASFACSGIECAFLLGGNCECFNTALQQFATAIASGDYAKGQTGKAIKAGARAIDRSLAWDVESVDARATELTREEQTKVAHACIAAYLAAMEAEGFVMVPVEATEAMWGAAEKESARIHHSQHWGWIYAAMLSARPNVKG